MFVWRLILDKVITYSETENLNFIDTLKMNAILDFRSHLEKEQQEFEFNKKEG